ncbi:MAG: hypothetical protein HOH82_01520, partial [Planctomycetaceae bacterium]|nr:hypothetical protein [Planctomycetaceae bacterium]
MSDKTYDPADPRLTAYVLGELDDSERQDVEQQIQRCAETRAAVEEIRETVGMLTSALANEPTDALSDDQRTAIAAEAAAPITVQRASNANVRGQLASFAAGITATALTFLLIVPQFGQQMDESDQANSQLISQSAKTAAMGDRAFLAQVDDAKTSYPDLNNVLVDELGDVENLSAMGPSVTASAHVGGTEESVRVRDGRKGLGYAVVTGEA